MMEDRNVANDITCKKLEVENVTLLVHNYFVEKQLDLSLYHHS